MTYHFPGWISKKPLVNPRSSIRPIDARPDQVSYEIAYDGEGLEFSREKKYLRIHAKNAILEEFQAELFSWKIYFDLGPKYV